VRFNTSGETEGEQKNEKEGIKHCKSAKDITKPLHTYNKSTETTGNGNEVQNKYQT
jgi:hypothetical protein